MTRKSVRLFLLWLCFLIESNLSNSSTTVHGWICSVPHQRRSLLAPSESSTLLLALADPEEEVLPDIDQEVSLTKEESDDFVDDDDVESPEQWSAATWKRKRHFLLRSVAERVQSGDDAVPAARMAIRRLKYWKDHHRPQEESEGDTNTLRQAYHLLLHALIQSSTLQDTLPSSVESLLRSMTVPPDAVTYGIIAASYANRGDAEAAERLLFEWMEGVERQPRSKNVQKTSRCDKAVHVLCDTVLHGWAQKKTWDGAARAQLILDRLEVLPADSPLSPTLVTYGTVIKAWGQCDNGKGSYEGAERAQAIMNRLESSSTAVGALKPDVVLYNAVIHAWAQCGDPRGASKAVEHLRLMQEQSTLTPDVITYNTVLSALARSGHVNAARQAERVLYEMVLRHRKDPMLGPAPNTVSYNSVLLAWGKENPERAASLLAKLMRARKADTYSFTVVLDAYAKSKHPGKAQVAKKLLDQLLAYDIPASQTQNGRVVVNSEITAVPYNAVLNAAAFSMEGSTQEQVEAWKVASETMRQLMNDSQRDLTRSTRSMRATPDTISFGNFFKVLVNLRPPGHVSISRDAWHDCCRRGLVGDLVWTQIQRLLPRVELLGNNSKVPKGRRVRRASDLPRAWTRNALGGASSNPSSSPNRRNRRRAPSKSDAKRRSGKHPPKAIPAVRRMSSLSETSYQSNRDL